MGILSRARRSKATEPVDWSDLRPVTLREAVDRPGDDGEPRVTLLVPRFRSRWLIRLSDALRIQPYRLRLDRLGSHVWRLCDGERSFAEIQRALEEQFPDEEKLEERLQVYLGQLARGRFVELRRPSPGGEPERRGDG